MGYNILKDIKFPWPIAEIAHQHHERVDGSGYPNRLRGEAILLEARIVAIADVVESIASHRPYRPTLGLQAAIDEIKNNRGTLYDSRAVDACLEVISSGFEFT
jgi:HD-GYP domain-containing protein (c-di-GMP phosphodiesterase class II)